MVTASAHRFKPLHRSQVGLLIWKQDDSDCCSTALAFDLCYTFHFCSLDPKPSNGYEATISGKSAKVFLVLHGTSANSEVDFSCCTPYPRVSHHQVSSFNCKQEASGTEHSEGWAYSLHTEVSSMRKERAWFDRCTVLAWILAVPWLCNVWSVILDSGAYFWSIQKLRWWSTTPVIRPTKSHKHQKRGEFLGHCVSVLQEFF